VAYYINKPKDLQISHLVNKTYSVKTLKDKITNLKIPVNNDVACKIMQIDSDEQSINDYWVIFKNFDVLKLIITLINMHWQYICYQMN